MTSSTLRRANVVGIGLIGGSIAIGLRHLGWHVTGSDRDVETLELAQELDVIDAVGTDPEAEITFVATPVLSVIEEVHRALAETSGIVTDVGSVKATIAQSISNPRFVAGHPMAGSEQDGVAGARPNMFHNSTWVLTPTEHTSETAFTTVREVVSLLGSEVVSMEPVQHDSAVARISHVPHLTAATLMKMALRQGAPTQASGDAALKLAAGGFRDMTRIASGNPEIWLDICAQNKTQIVDSLDALISELSQMRSIVAMDRGDELLERLSQARSARTNLPVGIPADREFCEVRVTMPDRPGEMARIVNIAPELNIYDFEIAHSLEGSRGVAILVVALEDYPAYKQQLIEGGYSPAMRKLQ